MGWRCGIDETDNHPWILDAEVKALEARGCCLDDDGGHSPGDVPVVSLAVFAPGTDPLMAGYAQASLVVLGCSRVMCRSADLVYRYLMI